MGNNKLHKKRNHVNVHEVPMEALMHPEREIMPQVLALQDELPAGVAEWRNPPVAGLPKACGSVPTGTPCPGLSAAARRVGEGCLP